MWVLLAMDADKGVLITECLLSGPASAQMHALSHTHTHTHKIQACAWYRITLHPVLYIQLCNYCHPQQAEQYTARGFWPWCRQQRGWRWLEGPPPAAGPPQLWPLAGSDSSLWPLPVLPLLLPCLVMRQWLHDSLNSTPARQKHAFSQCHALPAVQQLVTASTLQRHWPLSRLDHMLFMRHNGDDDADS